MSANDCKDRVRFSLSDKSGVLRFERFDIADKPECQRVLTALRDILLDRPLSEIDLAEIEQVTCPHGDECTRAVAKVIQDCQKTFTRGR